MLGGGTTFAMVGAYILVSELRRHCGVQDSENSLETALTAYESVFMPFMTKLQRAVSIEELGWDKIFATLVGIKLLNIVFRLCVALLN